MQCREAKKRLHLLLFDETEDAELRQRLRKHVETCPACRGQHDAMSAAVSLLREGLDAEPTPVLTAQRREAIRNARTADPAWSGGQASAPARGAVIFHPWFRRPLRIAAVLVALLAAAVFLWPVLRFVQRRGDGLRIARGERPAPETMREDTDGAWTPFEAGKVLPAPARPGELPEGPPAAADAVFDVEPRLREAPAAAEVARFENQAMQGTALSRAEPDTATPGEHTESRFDIGSVAVVRGYLDRGTLPPPEEVRNEDFIQAFTSAAEERSDRDKPVDGMGRRAARQLGAEAVAEHTAPEHIPMDTVAVGQAPGAVLVACATEFAELLQQGDAAPAESFRQLENVLLRIAPVLPDRSGAHELLQMTRQAAQLRQQTEAEDEARPRE